MKGEISGGLFQRFGGMKGRDSDQEEDVYKGMDEEKERVWEC